jgi:MFS family permease
VKPVRLGLRENLAQFSLLVVVNAFVGAMVGMERSILPVIAEDEFHLALRSAILSFIVVFGVTKALTNYFAGRWSDRFGRKHVLVAGWLVADRHERPPHAHAARGHLAHELYRS